MTSILNPFVGGTKEIGKVLLILLGFTSIHSLIANDADYGTVLYDWHGRKQKMLQQESIKLEYNACGKSTLFISWRLNFMVNISISVRLAQKFNTGTYFDSPKLILRPVCRL
jgi:hypothetical protein